MEIIFYTRLLSNNAKSHFTSMRYQSFPSPYYHNIRVRTNDANSEWTTVNESNMTKLWPYFSKERAKKWAYMYTHHVCSYAGFSHLIKND